MVSVGSGREGQKGSLVLALGDEGRGTVGLLGEAHRPRGGGEGVGSGSAGLPMKGALTGWHCL